MAKADPADAGCQVEPMSGSPGTGGSQPRVNAAPVPRDPDIDAARNDAPASQTNRMV